MGDNTAKIFQSFEQEDIYCQYKYKWTTGGTILGEADVDPGGYLHVYHYPEPKSSVFTENGVVLDTTCDAPSPGKHNYALTLWFCLEWCQKTVLTCQSE